MTNPKDPQAELREQIVIELANHFWEDQRYTASGRFEEVRTEAEQMVDQLLQAHQQELLTGLLGGKQLYGYDESGTEADYAVPVEVIEHKIGELNG